MKNIDWSKFNKKISIHADSNLIFNSWTTQDSIEKWFLSKAEFKTNNNVIRERFSKIEKGDKYVWMWHGSDNVAEGEILENNGKDFLEFTFLGCIVSVEIKTEAEETIIEIIQSNIPLDETSRFNYYVGCSRGWTFYLTNLKSILEGGIDLRNKNKNLVDVINT